MEERRNGDMQIKKFMIALTLVSVMMTGMAFAQIGLENGPVAKQLAGPPAEFLTGAIRAPRVDEDGLRSKSAMLPVALTGNSWSGEIAIEEGDRFHMMVLAPEGETWEISLRAPGSARATSVNELFTDLRQTSYGMGDATIPATVYSFDSMTAGTWQVNVTGDDNREEGSKAANGFLVFSSEGSYRLYSYITTRSLLVGSRIGVTAYGFDQALYDPEAKPEADRYAMGTAEAIVKTPSGQTLTLPMYDDGLHEDVSAGDGIYGAAFVPVEEGQYLTQVVANGVTPKGSPFLRTAEHTFQVLIPEIQLEGTATTAVQSDRRMGIDLTVDSFEGARDRYRAIAEVWGSDDEGNAIPVAWIGGMVRVKDGILPLSLDGRWISMAGATGPFELRNVRVEDPDYFVPVTTAERIELPVERLPEASFRAVTQIDDEMLMGPKPAPPINRAGSRLLLVHGYCSGDVWGPVKGQFASSSVFYDLNKNRSHDYFAQLIWSFGNSYSSYGIVAHSQGGAASLHLYTYYYSGLDYASGSRLIQSVGTPYQGTSLAGNLAALGEIFGIGCGTNTDLTYNGASSWLSGIPSWARGEVNFYTTSFTDVWWAYDYCHLGSDLLLSDPDDGTTEKSKGYLSSGINRGHKTGWCHTSGMRDPAQYTDSSRNSTMSANAAR
jgi:hypothetical protein